jgi:hypothetical protein
MTARIAINFSAGRPSMLIPAAPDGEEFGRAGGEPARSSSWPSSKSRLM